MTNSEIREYAKQYLEGNWKKIVLMLILQSVITGLISAVLDFTIGIESINNFILGVISSFFLIGVIYALLKIIRYEEEVEISDLFYQFSNFGKCLAVSFLHTLLVSIGFILFIIPGIIFSLMFAFVSMIVIEYEDMSVIEIFKLCKSINNKKLQLFL